MTDQPGDALDDAADDAFDGAPDETPEDGVRPDDDRPAFRLGYVPGATPGRWARTWRDRLPDVRLELVQTEVADAPAALAGRRVDAALLRLPVDGDVLHAIPLYTELPVVAVSRDHLLAATTEEEVVTADDLADDVVWLPADDVLYPAGEAVPGRAPEAYDDGAGGVVEPERPATAADAIALVATGVGVTVVPMSLARLHHRKDVTYRVLDGGPKAPVGLAWLVEGLPDDVHEQVEEMIGIVRGRTVNSSRGRAGRERAETEEAPRGAADARRAAGRRDGGRGVGRTPRPRGGGKPGRGRPRGGRGRH
ncbi:LysR substrate-binding domain-containing protein [Krasilnikoviella flava]|uniref:LysR substrate binding domain-containing protein n=1 Tax=Krasilnikoviella flava TaxID=526729 RepID=A0A1T5ICI9_9MICO|nr:LysR substrate-binding domain-containing protein [Krasilnikoviella flava]SKC36906.1 LysR substrate binding domain-containing protein [Krasilnikoviella flava]